MPDIEVKKLIAHLGSQRQSAWALLEDITDDQLDFVWDRIPGEEGPFTIRRLLHRVITHHEDHLQHVRKSRQMIGKPRTETQRLLARLQVLRAELIASLIGLDDADITKDITDGRPLGALTPNEYYPDELWVSEIESLYTIKRVIQHVVEMETMRWSHIKQAMDKATTD